MKSVIILASVDLTPITLIQDYPFCKYIIKMAIALTILKKISKFFAQIVIV